MPRVFAIGTTLLSLVIVLTAFRGLEPGYSYHTVPFNSSVSPVVPRVVPSFPMALTHIFSSVDSAARPNVLMLNYSAYNAQYAEKAARFIRNYWPNCNMVEFWEGTPVVLEKLLADRKIVIVPYAAEGSPELIKAYGVVLEKFVRKGGTVIFTGSHIYSVIQQYGLIDFDFGYFCRDLDVELLNHSDHAILNGIPDHFTLANFAYPLDISDPEFQILAEVRDYPVVGLKPIGAGQVFYLGLEYFYDEQPSTMLLANAVRFAIHPPEPVLEPIAAVQREVPAPEPPKTPIVPTDLYNLKVYPNPYVYKATVDIELRNPAVASIEMTDESGRVVATPLPRRSLAAGPYQFELPNLPPGIYFIQYQLNEYTNVRKVVKVAAP